MAEEQQTSTDRPQPDAARRRFGTNTWIVDEMYREYLADPESVGESWKEFFSDYEPGGGGADGQPGPAGGNGAGAKTTEPEQAPAKEDDGSGDGEVPEGAEQIRGVSARIAENMDASLGVPTATSIRQVPAKLLEVNRKIINNQLRRTRGGKVSFTHLIGWAIVRAMVDLPAMASIYHTDGEGTPFVHRPEHFNLGLAVDVERKGGRILLVPNIKEADTLDFAGFFRAYEDVIRKIKNNELSPELFEGTTATLTNPGTIGTMGSVPRLMPGQSVIVGVGAIDYPSEYQGADPQALADIGVGKTITITSTYDHRVIQGAESGMFLQRIHQFLLGEEGFYDEIFESLRLPYEPVRWRTDDNQRVAGRPDKLAEKQIAVQKLVNQYRVRGHLIAHLNPLQHTFRRVHPELDPATYGLTIWDLDREFHTGGFAGAERMALGNILGVLRDAYCRTVGVEYMHIAEPPQKSWIQDRVEGVSQTLEQQEQRHILECLNAAEAFEKFLHTKYLGQKRFSLEGAESTIPMLDALLNAAADAGIEHAVMGMAHRGRLNVLVNILHKDFERVFDDFEGHIDPNSVQGSGDVKYHVGQEGKHTSLNGNTIGVSLASNPSHLEAVNPVVVGMARAKADQAETSAEGEGAAAAPVLPVLLHGDAAFAGQGVVAEQLSMSQLRGYKVGGTVHLIINNQLGFTTAPHQGRSSEYATDVAKTVQAPIFHVNGDDPEACVRVMRLAFEFRKRFAKDVVVDLICYRRHGHNEGDDPSYTQPVMYRAIENRRSVRKIYTEELVNRGDLTIEEAEETLDDFRNKLEGALQETRESAPSEKPKAARPPKSQGVLPPVETGVERDRLQQVVDAITSWPDDFEVNPKLGKQLEKRRSLLDDDAVDWAMGEALAFGTLLLDGFPVRVAGQDSRRGTFSQRHAVLVDYTNGDEYIPLAHVGGEDRDFAIYDSPLNEFAAVGFEYGYSVVRKDALVAWEAQFGDFINGAQVIIDQFIVAAEDKWNQTSGLVMLLPHGYEGQGPEHSSARLERFLTLAAEDNLQVAQPTTSAQHFHLLRRQLHRDIRKPLIVLTPKGMLRAKPAQSPTEEFTGGHFYEVLPEPAFAEVSAGKAPSGGAPARDDVQRVLLCSGRVAYDLISERDEREAPAAVVRVEQLYPWPGEQIREAIDAFPNATEVLWVQDEPENMGAWPFAHMLLYQLVSDDYTLHHAARVPSGSPATGSSTIHEQEQEQLMETALGGLD